jgi:hypothetical protein
MCGAFILRQNCNAPNLVAAPREVRCYHVNFRAMRPISALLTGVSVP